MSNKTSRLPGQTGPITVIGGRSPVIRKWVRGNPANAAWVRPALLGLLVLTSVLYMWGLDRNGWANSYYSAAAMSGSEDWTAFFYGSFDPGNAITVDKPPMSLWIMSLSVRIFGLSSWSILLPQALMGVLSVYLLYRLVQKRTDAATGLLAGLFFAVTPVATVMFRYNNPDALLTLLMIGAAYTALEAIDTGKLRWLLAAGALIGAGFLTKQLQVTLILPAIALAYVVFARFPVYVRLLHLGAGLLAAVVASGWWFMITQTADPARRPFIGGSRSNSMWELTLGYNGLDRLTGADASRTTSGATTAALDVKLDPGITRFLQPQFSGQFGWFLPLAIAGLGITILFLIRRRSISEQRPFLVLCATWFVCSATVLAMMSGTVHPYYAISTVPSLSCLAAFAATYLMRRLSNRPVRLMSGLVLALSLVLGYVSASRSVQDFPLLPPVLLVLGALAIAVALLPPVSKQLRAATVLLIGASLLLGPTIWSINTELSPHVGAEVVAGPSILGIRTDHPDGTQLAPGTPVTLTAALFGDVPPPGVLERIQARPAARWAAAVVGSETAANYQLDSSKAVLAVGGFDGTDPFPTLEQFQSMVRSGEVGSFVIKNLPPLTAEGKGESARIVHWVESNFQPEIIEGASFYPLTQ